MKFFPGAILLMLLAGGAFALASGRSAAVDATALQDPLPLFRAETTLSPVPFYVIRKGRFIKTLTADDVLLLVDGRPQPIKLFEGALTGRRKAPVDILLLFDVSGSVSSAHLLDPLVFKTSLLDELPQVRLAVYSFSTVLKRFSAPTRDADALADAFGRLARSYANPYGKAEYETIALSRNAPAESAATWLYEAIVAAAKDSATWGDASRMLVVFSDGISTTAANPQEAVSVAHQLGMPIDPVALGRHSEHLNFPGNREKKMATFLELGEMTGGLAFDPPDVSLAVVKKILAGVAEQVRCQYVAAYQVTRSEGRPRSHTVQVRLRSRKLGTLYGGFRTVIY